MSALGVQFTFINKTSERLEKDSEGTSAIVGHWVDLPDTIKPHDRAIFQIAGDSPFDNSFVAKNAFMIKTDVDNNPRAWIHTSATCSFGVFNRNDFTPEPLEPMAVYESSFRTKSGSGEWQDNSVAMGGHPLWVEYTVKYQSRPYHFKLVKVTAQSDQPLRNSRGNLITGTHTLWDSDTAAQWADGTLGSYAPNVFDYESGSNVADRGHVDVTIRPLDPELVGAEAIVYGSIDGRMVFQTDYFFIKNLKDRAVTAHISDPKRSEIPFSKNADVVWTMQLRQPGALVAAQGPYTTRLELYWLGKNMHPAFWNGIPVGFLRSVFSEARSVKARVKPNDVISEWYEMAANDVFGGYNKSYDTCNGASAFDMTVWGGVFAEAYYRAVAPGSQEIGTLYRTVNCFDQAGMLELVCSFSVILPHLTSWLLQKPFGFIHTTKLVGVGEGGRLMAVNNPFFGTDTSRALVDDNDRGRTYFGCHVYVGHKKPFDRDEDPVYDACAGPHTGTENAAGYLNSSRQDETQTQLYASNNTYPGRVDTIAEGSGVTGIDGQPYQPGGPVALQHAQRAAAVLTSLVGAPPELYTIAITHVDWAHVDAWVSDVLGPEWSVPFKSLAASNGSAGAFWHLSSTNDGDATDVRVNVRVESIVAEDGSLDVQRSAAAARDRAAEILLTTERDPEEIWTAGELDEYGDYSYQYKPDLGAGRIVVVAANTVVDIAGGVSTAALEPTAHRLLERVVRRDRAVPTLPSLSRGRTVALGAPYEGDVREVEAHTAQYDRENRAVSLPQVGARLTLEFDVDADISVASASSPEGKVLLDTYTIEGSGEQNKVRFILVPRESGTSAVSLHVADDRTMASTTHVISIHVE